MKNSTDIKEINLTKKDTRLIKDRAISLFTEKSIFNKERDFLTDCFTKSFIEFLNKKCYNIIDGKIIKK